jgi:hypothetical protein
MSQQMAEGRWQMAAVTRGVRLPTAICLLRSQCPVGIRTDTAPAARVQSILRVSRAVHRPFTDRAPG